LFDLGDQTVASLGEVPLERCREGAQRRRLGEPGEQRALGKHGLGPRDMVALCGADFGEHVPHSALASASTGALVRATRSCNTRRAAPESSDRAACSMPLSRSGACPATKRAAPLFSNTMSRSGPPAPPSKSRIRVALCW